MESGHHHGGQHHDWYPSGHSSHPPKSPPKILLQRVMEVEQKIIIMQLAENDRGRFLSVRELNGRRGGRVIIPLEGWGKIQPVIADMCRRE